jgi:hypothetical protein
VPWKFPNATVVLQLPGVLCEASPSSKPSYCFLPGWRSPAESVWSLLSKFQLLNRITLAELIAFVCGAHLKHPPEQLDLRASEHVSATAMTAQFALAPNDLHEAFAFHHTNDVLSEVYSHHLRFCARCLASGFHTIVFQFRPLRRCPLHNTRLRSRCPHCGQLLAYRIDGALAQYPYQCSHCQYRLAPHLEAPRAVPAPFHPSEIAALRAWRRCIDTYAGGIATGRLTLRDAITGRFLSRQNLRQRLRILERLQFLGDVQSLFQAPPPLLRRQRSRPRLKVGSQEIKLPPTPSLRTGLLEAWPDFGDGFRTFAAIYHRCRERLHIQSLIDNTPRTTLQGSTPKHLRVMTVDRVPTESVAALLWRMAWEGHRELCLLDDFFAPPLGVATWLAFAPLPSPATPSTQHRAWLRNRLVNHCSALLAHAQRLAGWMARYELYLLEPRLIAPHRLWLSHAYQPENPPD